MWTLEKTQIHLEVKHINPQNELLDDRMPDEWQNEWNVVSNMKLWLQIKRENLTFYLIQFLDFFKAIYICRAPLDSCVL